MEAFSLAFCCSDVSEGVDSEPPGSGPIGPLGIEPKPPFPPLLLLTLSLSLSLLLLLLSPSATAESKTST